MCLAFLTFDVPSFVPTLKLPVNDYRYVVALICRQKITYLFFSACCALGQTLSSAGHFLASVFCLDRIGEGDGVSDEPKRAVARFFFF